MASLQTEQQGQIKDDLAVSSRMQSCPPGGSKPKRTAKKVSSHKVGKPKKRSLGNSCCASAWDVRQADCNTYIRLCRARSSSCLCHPLTLRSTSCLGDSIFRKSWGAMPLPVKTYIPVNASLQRKQCKLCQHRGMQVLVATPVSEVSLRTCTYRKARFQIKPPRATSDIAAQHAYMLTAQPVALPQRMPESLRLQQKPTATPR